jgi:hypothetical protein
VTQKPRAPCVSRVPTCTLYPSCCLVRSVSYAGSPAICIQAGQQRITLCRAEAGPCWLSAGLCSLGTQLSQHHLKDWVHSSMTAGQATKHTTDAG